MGRPAIHLGILVVFAAIATLLESGTLAVRTAHQIHEMDEFRMFITLGVDPSNVQVTTCDTQDCARLPITVNAVFHRNMGTLKISKLVSQNLIACKLNNYTVENWPSVSE